MKSFLAVAFVAILCFVPYKAQSAGLWLYEMGTPDMGTAAAGRVALASDASTASTNPAGMTRLDRSQLLAGFQILYVDLKFDTEYAEFGGGNGGNAGGGFLRDHFLTSTRFLQNWLSV